MKARTSARQTIWILAIVLFGYPLAGIRAETPPAAASADARPAPKADARSRKAAKAKPAPPTKPASKLNLSVPDQPSTTRENPNHTASVLRDSESGLSPRAASNSGEIPYKTEPLFQSEQRLQILDTEVPVSVKLGKWKTSEESKALGLSATVPLKVE